MKNLILLVVTMLAGFAAHATPVCRIETSRNGAGFTLDVNGREALSSVTIQKAVETRNKLVKSGRCRPEPVSERVCQIAGEERTGYRIMMAHESTQAMSLERAAMLRRWLHSAGLCSLDEKLLKCQIQSLGANQFTIFAGEEDVISARSQAEALRVKAKLIRSQVCR